MRVQEDKTSWESVVRRLGDGEKGWVVLSRVRYVFNVCSNTDVCPAYLSQTVFIVFFNTDVCLAYPRAQNHFLLLLVT